jgi:hypothetical protein
VTRVGIVLVALACAACSRDIPFDSTGWKSADADVRDEMVADLHFNGTLMGKSESDVLARLGAPDVIETSLEYHLLKPDANGWSPSRVIVVFKDGVLADVQPWVRSIGVDVPAEYVLPGPWPTLDHAQKNTAALWMSAHQTRLPQTPVAFRSWIGIPDIELKRWYYAGDFRRCKHSDGCFYSVLWRSGVVCDFGLDLGS